MKYFIIILLLFTGCSSTQMINYHLKRSKWHLLRAESLGANLDSIKTTVKQTGNVGSLKDSATTTAKVDTTGAIDACAELLSSVTGENNHLRSSLDSLIDANNKLVPPGGYSFLENSRKFLRPIKAIQKAVCPDDSVTKHLDIPITVGGHNYKIPVTVHAYSTFGKAGYSVDVAKTDFDYVKQEVTVKAEPGKVPGFFAAAGRDLLWFVAGAAAMFVVLLLTGRLKIL